MKKCNECKRVITIFNMFHRQYPGIEVINKKIKPVYFCSHECTCKYINKLIKREKK